MASARRGSRRRPSLNEIDLNLLVAFQALYRERSVTKAGRRLGLSQPATSAVLARLRAALGDELFVTTPHGLEPTARSEALARPVAEALGQLDAALAHDDRFDPGTAAVTFRLGAVDAVMAPLLPALSARLAREAPRASLVLRSIDPREAPALIDRGDIDLAIAPVPDAPAHLSQRELFPIPFVIAVRPEHPLSRAPALAEIAAYPHVVVSFAAPTRARLDEALRAAGLGPHVAVVLSSFLAVPHVLAHTDALAVVPEPFGRALEAAGRLRCAPLPPALAKVELRMRLYWPARVSGAPAWRWLRELVVDVVRGMGGGRP